MLLSDFRRDFPGYFETLFQEKLYENPQYDNANSISLLGPIDIGLGFQQQLDKTINSYPLTQPGEIGTQTPENNRAVGLITKLGVGSPKTDNRSISSQGSANRDKSVPRNTTADNVSGKSRDDTNSNALKTPSPPPPPPPPTLKMSRKMLDWMKT